MKQSWDSAPIKNHSVCMPASRRDLLKGLSLAGVATGSAAVLTALPAAAEPNADASQNPRALKYRETNHIRTFYALARK